MRWTRLQSTGPRNGDVNATRGSEGPRWLSLTTGGTSCCICAIKPTCWFPPRMWRTSAPTIVKSSAYGRIATTKVTWKATTSRNIQPSRWAPATDWWVVWCAVNLGYKEHKGQMILSFKPGTPHNRNNLQWFSLLGPEKRPSKPVFFPTRW